MRHFIDRGDESMTTIFPKPPVELRHKPVHEGAQFVYTLATAFSNRANQLSTELGMTEGAMPFVDEINAYWDSLDNEELLDAVIAFKVTMPHLEQLHVAGLLTLMYRQLTHPGL